MFSQLKSSINGMDLSEDIKSKIVSLISNVETTSNERFDDVKTSRDNEKNKRQALQSKLDEVGKTLKLDGDFGVDDVKSILDSSDKNADVEKIKADFDTRYNTDIKTVNDKLTAKENELQELMDKHTKTMFTNEIQNSGLLGDFIDEPMARNNILNLIAEKTITEDGKIYAKDDITGTALKDINNNNAPLGLEYVVNDIKASINPIYLKRETQGNGSGSMPSNQSSGGKKWSDFNTAELSQIRQANPTEYDRLKTTR